MILPVSILLPCMYPFLFTSADSVLRRFKEFFSNFQSRVLCHAAFSLSVAGVN